MIDQVCCIGDQRPYNVALVSLDPDFAPMWAGQQGIEEAEIAALAENPEVVEVVRAAIEKGNENLARVEQVKRFQLLPEDWKPGGDELTPTMKLKRKPIAEKYETEIEGLYAGDTGTEVVG